MTSRHARTAATTTAVVACGLLLRFVVGLEPVWWLAWLAPIPLLLLALSLSTAQARWATLVATLIGDSVNLAYLRLVMPWPAVVLVLLLQSLLWLFVVMTTRRIVLRERSALAVLAYPVAWVAADTLLATFAPDGNWASLAYTQSDVLPFMQVAALLGVPGLLFLLCLVPSTIAWLLWRRHISRGGVLAIALTAVAMLGGFGYGWQRLQASASGATMRVGLASIDDAIGPKASAGYIAPIRAGYDALVQALAAQGATLVVLPEKIAVVAPAATTDWQAHFSALAARRHVWLEVGLGIAEARPRNVAWLFDADGHLAESYEKHYLAPPERREDYAHGEAFATHDINGLRMGLAICKDMHFAALGRAYARLDVAVMIVPAWDFDYRDGWLEARTTSARGIENGYAVLRASREGLLTASDARGRILAETRSAPLPGASLLVDLPKAAAAPTPYTRIGDLLGWLCVSALIAWTLLRRRVANA